jgi:dipeptidyl aminopeptidase/acylaminoacyl peptidase
MLALLQPGDVSYPEFAWSPDSRHIAYYCDIGLCIVDVLSPDYTVRLLADTLGIGVYQVNFMPDGRWVVGIVGPTADFSYAQGRLCFWNVEYGVAQQCFGVGRDERFLDFAISPDGNYLAVREDDTSAFQSLVLYDTSDLPYSRRVWRLDEVKIPFQPRFDLASQHLIYPLTVAEGVTNLMARLLDGGEEQVLLPGMEYRGQKAYLLPHGNWIHINDKIVDLETGDLRGELPDEDSLMAVSPAGHLLATAENFEKLSLRDIWTGEEYANRAGHHTYLRTGRGLSQIRFSPDGRFIATAGDENTLRIWQVGPEN